MREADIKLLWGRSGNRCAICRCKLSQEPPASGALVVGEQAHIVGEKEDAPRGKSVLGSRERDAYANRILLCPNDHTLIDKAPSDYPVERLYVLKAEHELWVETQLAGDGAREDAAALIYATLIDDAVALCHLSSWTAWTAESFEPRWRMPAALVEEVPDFERRIFATDWPREYPDLEIALNTLASELSGAVGSFSERASFGGEGWIRVERHYKQYWNPRYERDAAEFFAWSKSYEQHVIRATASANWMREIWRREVNPLFFAAEGYFHLSFGPMEDGKDMLIKPLLTDEQKQELREG